MQEYNYYNLSPYKNTIYKDFYDELFNELGVNYIALGFPEQCSLVHQKAIYMPWDFINILCTPSMQAATGKIQTAHSYKLNDRMYDTRFEHMCFTYMLGVDLLIILKSKGYEIDGKTEVAFLLKLLLHDNGHGPFSHPFEEMVDGYKGMHEDIGARNIKEEHETFECLEKIYPGLANYIINFNELEPYGLHEVVEGIFDLDRAAFLIIDTWLSNPNLYPENSYQEANNLITSIYNIFHNIILKNGHIFYNPNCFHDIEYFIGKRKYNYCHIYQEKGRVLDDLLLHEFGLELERQPESEKFKTILKRVEDFKKFLAEIRKKKAQINLAEYYQYIDIDIEQIASLALLYDNPVLSMYARLFASPYHYMTHYFNIEVSKTPAETKPSAVSFNTINKIGIYKSTEKEHIIFYNPETDIYFDYKDAKERTIDIEPIIEYYTFTKKKGSKLKHETELRRHFYNYLLTNSQEKLKACHRQLYFEENPETRSIIENIIEILQYLCQGFSLEKYSQEKGISMNQILAFLSYFKSDLKWSKCATFLSLNSETLSIYFAELAFPEKEEAVEFTRHIEEILEYNQSLVDYGEYSKNQLLTSLIYQEENIIFIDLAILNSIYISKKVRESIESMMHEKEHILRKTFKKS